MSKQEGIEIDGIVKEKLKGGTFAVELSNGLIATCKLSGKLHMHHIRIVVGDKVSVEISPYDLSKGRIIWRY